jgi:hypothetical protein
VFDVCGTGNSFDEESLKGLADDLDETIRQIWV